MRQHPCHASARPELQRALAGRVTGLIDTHSLAEVFAVLTRLLLKPKIGSHAARTLIEANLQGFEVVPLEVVSRILSHAKVSITLDTYRDVLGSEKRAVMVDLFDALLPVRAVGITPPN